jgi:cullin 1
VSLGLDEADVQRQVLSVYLEYFQNPFIVATEKYYRAESAAYVQNNSVADYMKRAEARLAEENKRVDMYLHDSTRKEVCLQLSVSLGSS